MASGSIFTLDEFKDLAVQFEQRQSRFARNWAYYKATVYGKTDSFKTMTMAMMGQRFASAVQPLFTPLARAVRLDVALIPGHWKLASTATDLAPAVAAVFQASRWPVNGDIFVRYMAAMGEAGLWVVDDRNNGQIFLQAIRPDLYVTRTAAPWDPTVTQAVLISSATDENGQQAEAATVIEPDSVRTFVAGQPAGLVGREAAYINALGFVPLVEAKNDPGDGWGEPTFDDAIASLDQVNLQATHLANIIQRHVEPQWAAFGAEPGDLEKSGEAVWFFPEGSDVKAILAAVDFDGVLDFIKEIKQEVKDGLPELAFAQLVGIERVAVATIEIQMSEPVAKIRMMRKIVDQALADALRLVGRAAGTMPDQSELAVLDTMDLMFDPLRPVITADNLTRIQIEAAATGQQLQQIALDRELALDG